MQRYSHGNKTCFVSYLEYRHYFLAPFPRDAKFSSDVFARMQFSAFVNNTRLRGAVPIFRYSGTRILG